MKISSFILDNDSFLMSLFIIHTYHGVCINKKLGRRARSNCEKTKLYYFQYLKANLDVRVAQKSIRKSVPFLFKTWCVNIITRVIFSLDEFKLIMLRQISY